MTKDRRYLILIAILVCAPVLWLFLAAEDDDGRLESGPRAGEAAEADDGPSALQGREALEARRAAAHESAGESPDKIPADLSEYSDHQPVFGAGLFTGNAVAEFEIRDARDQVLPQSAGLRAALYRVESGARIVEGVEVDQRRGVIRCAGEIGDGLEPGSYALQVKAGPYGAFWKDFELTFGQQRRERMNLKTWTRVIKLRFEDREGSPRPLIGIEPRYTAKSITPPQRKFESGPARVLREPPGEDLMEGFGMGGGAGGATGARRGPRAHATLEGAWFLQVVAGHPGTLRIAFSKSRVGIDTIEVTGTFEGGEWDDYRIQLAPTEKHLARLARLPLSNPDNPGNQKAQIVPQPVEEGADPFTLDASIKNWGRVIFHPPEISHPRLWIRPASYGSSMTHLGRRYVDRKPRVSRGVHYSDVDLKRGKRITWRWHDGGLMRLPGSFVETAAFKVSGRLLERRDAGEFWTFDLVVEPVSPTFDAWARGLKVLWQLQQEGEAQARLIRRDEEGFRIDTGVGIAEDGSPLFASRLELRFKGDARWSSKEIGQDWTADMSRAAKSGEVRIKPELSGLVFRALDDSGRAIPWVEGSVTEFEDLELTERTRRILSASGVAVGARSNFLRDDLSRIDHVVLGEDSDLSELESAVGEKLWKALGDKAARTHVGRNGAWYNPWRKIRVDARGYAIATDMQLVPGRRYVLWLWSRSRDAYQPDRSVVFRAAKGLTDLGLLTLPRWN